MKNIPTAEDFLIVFRRTLPNSPLQGILNDSSYAKQIHQYAIEFAKLHCEAQQQVICKKAIILHINNTYDHEIDKDSILTAYPLNLIK